MKKIILILGLILIFSLPCLAGEEIIFDGETWEKETAPTDTIPGYNNAWHWQGYNEWINVVDDTTYTVYIAKNGIHIQDHEAKYDLLCYLIYWEFID